MIYVKRVKERENIEKTINLLKLVPVRNIKWDKNEEGLVVLLKPKIRNPFFAKHILPRLRHPYYKVKLDSVGSFVWERCDGRLTVQEVADDMKAKFGEQVEPLYDRLNLFLQSLEKNRFIFYKGLP